MEGTVALILPLIQNGHDVMGWIEIANHGQVQDYHLEISPKTP
jgi:hypothetical protein